MKAASDLLANNNEQANINKIMIVPHKSLKVLVVGYRGKRPTYLFDLDKNQIVSFKQDSNSDQSLEIVFWQIELLSNILESRRRQLLPNDEKILEIEQEITDKLSSCL